ncbi:Radical SAM superfamily protein [Variovorax sp. HW608]|nr:Radical SAM superfamily protein [Variovorax sp. HW608]
MEPRLPSTVCLRVTRYCNARCRFCLAPPDGVHPSADILKQRVDWLAKHGVRTIHFCGGEPTIHPGLPALLSHAQARGCATRLTTNGIVLPDALLSALRANGTEVKLSLHGDRMHHDTIVGRPAFDLATQHLHSLMSGGVSATVQTTVIAGAEWVLDWMADYCLAHGVRRLSILPFIPRGNGYRVQGEYGLTTTQRGELRERVRRKRHALQGRLDVRWLDFASKSLHVVEADGRVVLERASEAMDTVLGAIPEEMVARKRVPMKAAVQAAPGTTAHLRWKPRDLFDVMQL